MAIGKPHHKHTRSSGEQQGTTGERGPASEGCVSAVRSGRRPNQPQMIAASQAEGCGAVVARRLSGPALVDGASSVAEPGGGWSEAYARLIGRRTRRRG